MPERKTPQVRFKGFTDAWEQRKFAELYQRNDERNKGQFGWDRTISVSTMIFNESGNGAADSSLDNYKVLRVGDIAFEGHTNKEFRYGRFVLNDIENGIMSPRFTTLRPIADQDYSFWKYYIHSEKVMRQKLVNSTKAGTMMNELVIDDFLEQTIFVPKLDEQKKIGACLNNLDHLITLHQRECERLQMVKKSMLENCFPKNGEKVPRFRFAGFTGDWEQRKLGDFGSVAMCKRIFKDQTVESGEIPFYKIGTFGGEPDAYISRDLFEEYKHLYSYPEKGDILISASGSIGRTVEYTGEDAYYQDSNIVWLKHDKTIVNSFLKHLYEVIRWYGIEGSTIKRLYNDNILKTEVMIPSAPEQEGIGKYLNNIDNLITLHQSKLEMLKKIKESMLGKMLV